MLHCPTKHDIAGLIPVRDILNLDFQGGSTGNRTRDFIVYNQGR